MIPLYMIFPRLFTCPTMITPQFQVEFEVSLSSRCSDWLVIGAMRGYTSDLWITHLRVHLRVTGDPNYRLRGWLHDNGVLSD